MECNTSSRDLHMHVERDYWTLAGPAAPAGPQRASGPAALLSERFPKIHRFEKPMCTTKPKRAGQELQTRRTAIDAGKQLRLASAPSREGDRPLRPHRRSVRDDRPQRGRYSSVRLARRYWLYGSLVCVACVKLGLFLRARRESPLFPTLGALLGELAPGYG